tara:strand:- start:111 stop:290 length:180 start_codon:yes stop_codon:yes gene_type:complete
LIPADKKMKFYSGKNADKDEKTGKKLAIIKHEDFADVKTAWADIDILIYTGTLTAGISF